MNEAAERAGLPLDAWLQHKLLGHLGANAAGTPAADIAELRRRLQELSTPSAGPESATLPASADYRVESAAAPAGRTAAMAGASRTFDLDDRADMSARSRGPAALSSENFAQRMDEIMRTAESLTRRAPAAAPSFVATPVATPLPPAPSAASIEAAVAEIAARQRELEGGAPSRPLAAPDEKVEPATARPALSKDQFSKASSAREPLPKEPLVKAPATRAPEAPTALLREVAAEHAAAIAGLRTELGEMRAGLGDLAPRQAVDELQRTVHRLAERIEKSGIDNAELCTTLGALRDMIGALRLPEHQSVVVGRIDTLARKLDIVQAKQVDGAAVARLQAQVGEIRDLIGKALSNDAVRQLVQPVTLLVGKVGESRGASEETLRGLIGDLDNRLETLVTRIERQMSRPVVVPLDDVYRRLDDIQDNIAAARREAPATVEKALRGLGERLDRMERPAPAPVPVPDKAAIDNLSRQIASLADKAAFDSLSRQIGALADKLEAQNQPHPRLAGIERTLNDLFIQMEETRAALLAAPPRPPADPLKPSSPAATPPNAPDPASDASSEVAERAAAALASVLQEAILADAAGHIDPKPIAPAPVAPPAPAALPSAPRSSAAREAAPSPQPARPRLDAGRRDPHVVDNPLASPDSPRIPGAVGDSFSFRAPGGEPHAGEGADEAEPAVAAHEPAAPPRVEFIAQARRASHGSAQTPLAAPASSRLAESRANRSRSTRWVARIRAMLLVTICGSALAFASWHFLSGMKEGRLRANLPSATSTARTPSTEPLPDDITGSVPSNSVVPPAPAPIAPVAPEAPPAADETVPPGPSGMNVPEDLPAGIGGAGLRAAAQSGDPSAAYEVARRYMDGVGVAQSAAHAADWFDFAAEHGSIPAAYRLGAIYEKGADSVPRNPIRARALYEVAANGGNVRAMHNLGVMLANGADGSAADYKQAAVWFQKAATFGLRDSQYNLAVLYSRGYGVPADPGQAWLWFSLAAARGDAEAAQRRDEITSRLDAATLASVRKSLQKWTPAVVDATANDGTANPSWDQAPVSRKTASRM